MVKDQPKISVVMNCHNGSRYLREAIESVYWQDYEDWEIVFWDNGSDDGSGEIARSYDDGRLRYFRGEEKVSLGEARNLAMRECLGEYICFLDADDYWLSGKLSKQVMAMEWDNEIDLIYGNGYYLFEASGRERAIFRREQKSGMIFGECLRRYAINLQTVMLRREALEGLEGEVFDSYYELCEEADLFLRLLMRGRGYYMHDKLVVYRVHDKMESVKKMGRYVEETRYMLGKLRKLGGEELEGEYGEAIKYYEAKIGYWEARERMKGEWKKARGSLSRYKWVGLEFMGLYLLSFFGPRVWRWAHRISGKGVYVGV